MIFSLSLPGLLALAGHPSNRNATNFSTRVKYTTYVSGPPPPTSTPRVCGSTIPCVLSIWWWSDANTIAPPPLLANQPGFFSLPKTGTSPVALLFYAAVPCCPQIKTGLYTIYLVLPRFTSSPPSRRYSPPPSVSSGLRWDFSLLCSLRLHKIQCCALLPSNPTCYVPPEVCKLPTGPPLPLDPRRC